MSLKANRNHLVFWFFVLLSGCDSSHLREVDLGVRTKDLGMVGANEKATHTFRIVNTTSSQLRIDSVKKSCGCTETDLSDGATVKSGGELLVKVAISGRASGGKEIGELFINTNSDCSSLRNITLSLAADFPKTIWSEPSELFVSESAGFDLRLNSSLPELMLHFQKVEVKPDVLQLKLLEQTSSCLEFKAERDLSSTELDWVYAFAVFQFDDKRMPIHTVMVRNQDRIKPKPAISEGSLK